MVGLLILAALGGVVLVLYAAERALKARRRARRRRVMSRRLAQAAARGEQQHERREAVREASAELTAFLPAINQPPLAVPGVAPARPDEEEPGQDRVA